MQVASHAQKYFLREGLPPSKREKKRPSIHDIRCSRNASQEDRTQLRSSLQQLNRESMESNDSRQAETQHAGTPPARDTHPASAQHAATASACSPASGRQQRRHSLKSAPSAGPKLGTGPLAGGAGRPRAETGSSGDTSVAAGSRPAPSTPPRRRLCFPSRPPVSDPPSRNLDRSRRSLPCSRPPATGVALATTAPRAVSDSPPATAQLPCGPISGELPLPASRCACHAALLAA